MPKYSPIAHALPHTANIDSLNVKGQGPGMVFAQVNNASTFFYVATTISSDGFPSGMVAIDPKAVVTVF